MASQIFRGPAGFLVGHAASAHVDRLLSAFTEATDMRRPILATISGDTGLGKTRLVQEFYDQLRRRSTQQPQYWPALELDLSQPSDRHVTSPPTRFDVPAGCEPNYLWWSISRSLPGRSVIDEGEQFFLAHRGENALRERDGAALRVVDGVLQASEILDPINAARVLGSGALAHARRRRQRRRFLRSGGTVTTDVGVEQRADALVAAIERESRRCPIVLVADGVRDDDMIISKLLRDVMNLREASALLVVTGDRPSARSGLLSDLRAVTPLTEIVDVELRPLADDDVNDLIQRVAPYTSLDSAARTAAIVQGNPLLLHRILQLESIRRDIGDGALDTDISFDGKLPYSVLEPWLTEWQHLSGDERIALALAAELGAESSVHGVQRLAAEIGLANVVAPALNDLLEDGSWLASDPSGVLRFTSHVREQVARNERQSVIHESTSGQQPSPPHDDPPQQAEIQSYEGVPEGVEPSESPVVVAQSHDRTGSGAASDLDASIMGIVTSEGPMCRHHLHRLAFAFTQGQRLTEAERRRIDGRIDALVRIGALSQHSPLPRAPKSERVIRIPGTPEVVMRDDGGRRIEEIPLDELLAAGRQALDGSDVPMSGDQLIRRALIGFGSPRLTARVRERWRPILRLIEKEQDPTLQQDRPAATGAGRSDHDTDVGDLLAANLQLLDEFGPEIIETVRQMLRFPDSLDPQAFALMICTDDVSVEVAGFESRSTEPGVSEEFVLGELFMVAPTDESAWSVVSFADGHQREFRVVRDPSDWAVRLPDDEAGFDDVLIDLGQPLGLLDDSD